MLKFAEPVENLVAAFRIVASAKDLVGRQLALDFATEHLKPGGAFLIKVFQGAGFEAYLRVMRSQFRRVVTRKPKASRDRSSEVYLLGLEKLE